MNVNVHNSDPHNYVGDQKFGDQSNIQVGGDGGQEHEMLDEENIGDTSESSQSQI